MTASDLNYAMQYIDNKYLDIVDAPEKKMMKIVPLKKAAMILFPLLTACLIIGILYLQS